MTGYASAQHSPVSGPIGHESGKPATPASRLGLEIRSVNSRFLDLAFRLGEELRAHEPALRELITGKIKRGKVEVRAGVEGAAAEAVREPAVRALQRVAAVQDTVRSWMPDAGALSVAEILRLAQAETGSDVDWGEPLLALANKVVADLLAAREREGARLVAMLLGHLKQLRALAEQAQPLVPQLVEQQRQRFLERWKEAMGLADGAATPEAAQDRALTEATAFAIRIDVAEELTRISVDMKVLIEQMREQVQNIE
jgi:uncharacterized protein (TIGR00255 family)